MVQHDIKVISQKVMHSKFHHCTFIYLSTRTPKTEKARSLTFFWITEQVLRHDPVDQTGGARPCSILVHVNSQGQSELHLPKREFCRGWLTPFRNICSREYESIRSWIQHVSWRNRSLKLPLIHDWYMPGSFHASMSDSGTSRWLNGQGDQLGMCHGILCLH